MPLIGFVPREHDGDSEQFNVLRNRNLVIVLLCGAN